MPWFMLTPTNIRDFPKEKGKKNLSLCNYKNMANFESFHQAYRYIILFLKCN